MKRYIFDIAEGNWGFVDVSVTDTHNNKIIDQATIEATPYNADYHYETNRLQMLSNYLNEEYEAYDRMIMMLYWNKF